MPDLTAIKVRLYPDKEQREQLDRAFGCCRFLWNQMLAEHKQSYEQYKIDGIKLKYRTEKEYKILFPFLKEIDAKALQNVNWKLQDTYTHFFQNIKDRKAGMTKRHVGYPRFKHKHGKQSFTTNNINDNVKIDFVARKLKLPKIDWISYRDDRVFEEKIRSITVSKTKSGRYFASILIACEDQVIPLSKIHEEKVVAFDMSMKGFLVSEECKLGNPRFFRQSINKIRKLHRKVSRTKKGSSNRDKACQKLAAAYEHYVNQKKDWEHKLTRKLADEHDAVIVEDLNIEGMKQFNTGYAKSITKDISWSKFIAMLGYKLARLGRHLVKVNRFFPSSQLCSSCGYQYHELALDQREWTCPACGSIHDRDVNAAKNIKREGMGILRERNITVILDNATVGTTGSNAFGDLVRPLALVARIDEEGIHGH